MQITSNHGPLPIKSKNPTLFVVWLYGVYALHIPLSISFIQIYNHTHIYIFSGSAQVLFEMEILVR